MKRHFLFWAVFALALSACATLEKRAKEMLEKGSYEEAVTAYDTLTQRDPSNPEYQAGLRTARQGYLSDKLIEVRRLRTAGKPADAAELLMLLMDKEKAWNIGPGGNAVATQEEELQLGAQFVLGLIRKSIHDNKVMPVELVLKKYQPLFASRLKKDYSDLVQQNHKRGLAQCQKLTQGDFSKKPWVAEFVEVFCGYFDFNPSLKGYNVSDLLEDRIPSIEFSGQLEGAKGSEMAKLTQSLSTAFKETPWFHPKGRNGLKMVWSGSFKSTYQKVPTQLVHEYTTIEYYMGTQRVARNRTVYTGTIPLSETYYVEEPIQLSRPVRKVFPYGAWHIVQTADFDVSALGKLGRHDVVVQGKNALNENGNENEMTVASVGLQPYKAQLSDLNTWFDGQAQALGSSLKSQLLNLWIEIKCSKPASEAGFISLGNDVQECLGANPTQPPDFVNQWYQQYFGLDPATTDTLLKITRSKSKI